MNQLSVELRSCVVAAHVEGNSGVPTHKLRWFHDVNETCPECSAPLDMKMVEQLLAAETVKVRRLEKGLDGGAGFDQPNEGQN